MIKLLYTVNGLRVNGVSAVIMQYITMLNKNDYEISLFTDEIAPQFKQVLQDNHVNVITSANRKKNQLAYYKELKGILNNVKYDIIHAHGNSATLAVEMLAAKKCGVKIRIAHSHNTTCVHKSFDKILRPLFYKTYTHGIGCGDEAGRWLFGNHPHVVIKNGIDLQKYSFDCQKRDEIRKKLGISEKVVAIHVCIAVLGNFDNYSQLDAVLYASVRNIFHFAVPIFFMISGALILSPDRELPLKKLLGRYLLKYGLVIVVFGRAFAAIERYFVSKKMSIDLLTGSFLDMLTGKSWAHMWYMYALLGTMLVVPILRWIAKHCQKSYMCYFLVVFSVFLTVLPVGEHYLHFKLGVALPFNSVYCFYMLLGYWIDHEDIRISKKISVAIMAVLFPVIIVLTVLQQIYQFDTEVLFACFSPVIGVLSVGVFSFFRNMENTLSAKETPVLIKFLGKYSFGVYILHMFWINIAYKLLKFDPFQFNAVAGFFILWIIVSLLSVLTSWAMKHIPLLKKIV